LDDEGCFDNGVHFQVPGIDPRRIRFRKDEATSWIVTDSRGEFDVPYAQPCEVQRHISCSTTSPVTYERALVKNRV
jgi:hypothetical protein